MAKEREAQLAKDMASGLNSLTFDPEAFCEQMLKEHPTLQQSFMRVCLEWIREVAEKKNYDERSEATVIIAKDLKKHMEEEGIYTVPYI